ncbi:non-ribosomal peptide synthetase [Trichoderma guizhouense]|uniref:Non-ribosomal peptide synthetase n=1 Tax=Trichoderma guizhouense TaxID=1491466 RepID=A0A1T3CVS7_9HYPO|nr:non-ribosomal peptide synthetase [Trichoderma guizhouense]
MVSLNLEEIGIGPLVAAMSRSKPDDIAIISDEMPVTYKDLHLMAQSLGNELVEAGIAYQDIVGILTEHGVNHIVSQLAVIYAGGTCLPLEETLSDADIHARLAFANARFLIVDGVNKNRLQFGGVTINVDISKHHSSNTTTLPSQVSLPKDTPSDFRSHVMFSSGTTGVAKGIQILGRGITSLALDEIWGQPTASGQRFGHINSIGFDASLVDIWVALLLGATIVVVDRRELLSPGEFATTLARRDVTTLLITSSLFSKIASFCPNAFSKMHTLMVGGELPSVEACKIVLREGAPKQLVNAYGPTECSIISFYHVITQEDIDMCRMPLGKPVYQTEAYVLDEDGKPVTSPGSGELWLGGPGLSPGYLFNDDKTSEFFIHMVHPNNPKLHIRLYRTGDKIDIYDDYMCWAGRKNREVKLNGHRVQLEVVEMELMRTKLVQNVVALKHTSSISNANHLVACVVYENGQRNFDALLVEAKRRLPKYMLPELIEFEQLPLNSNGKIAHRELSELLEQRFQRRHACILAANTPDFEGFSETEKGLKQLWAQILIAIPTEAINRESNFFLLGGTSLGVTALLGHIHKIFNASLRTNQVYENPLFKDQVSVIEQAQNGQSSGYAKSVTAIMQEDVKLFSDKIEFLSSKAPQRKEICNVLFTGATGFIGPFLLQELLKAPEIGKIRCLVRATTDDQALKRLLDNFKRYGHSVTEVIKSRIEAVAGDFSQPMLGLETNAYNHLVDQTDVVYHLGAHVDYTQPYSGHVEANVRGTYHLLKFASDGYLKPFHYVSSVSAFGPTGLMKEDGLLEEDQSLEPYLEPALQYDNGYGQSQWVADEMVSRLMRRGFPAAIYRLGFTLCSSTNGMGNPDDFMGRLFSDCAKLGSYPLLLNQRKEIMAVDHVAEIIKAISTSDQSLGHAYHITPDVGKCIDMNELFELTGKLCGVELKSLPYSAWINQLKTAQTNTPLRMFPLLPMLEEEVRGQKTRWELYEGMKRFSVDNTVRALERAGVDASILASVTREALGRYLENCLEIGKE